MTISVNSVLDNKHRQTTLSMAFRRMSPTTKGALDSQNNESKTKTVAYVPLHVIGNMQTSFLKHVFIDDRNQRQTVFPLCLYRYIYSLKRY